MVGPNALHGRAFQTPEGPTGNQFSLVFHLVPVAAWTLQSSLLRKVRPSGLGRLQAIIPSPKLDTFRLQHPVPDRCLIEPSDEPFRTLGFPSDP